jgi:Flp pilus assembly protein TadG
VSARVILRRWSRAEGGASATEFALVLPVLATFLMGVFEFGWTQHCMSSVRFSLEKAGRHLSLHPDATEDELADIVSGNLEDLAEDLVDVTLVREARGPTGETAVLTATYQRDVGFPGVATFPVDYEASIETPVSQFADP